MMRYVLIENAIVRCDDISQYALIDISSIFQEKDLFESGDYAPILQIIRSFLDKERGAIELVVSTLFYMVPCFVRVLQDSLGNTVKIIPLYELLGEDNLIEIYDHYTIEITNDQGNISCNVYQDDIMAKINIMSLGGLNENGKNLYTVSINDKILIFDCGIKYAPDKMYGVDYVIPDFTYLVENKSKIVGLFLSHPHF